MMDMASIYEEELFTETVYILMDFVMLDNGTTSIPEVERMPYQLRTALLVVISVIFIVGVAGNLLAIFIFLSTKALRTAPNYLIVNLSISDLMMIMSNAPVMLFSVFNGSWPFGPTGCKIYAFCGAISSFVSIGSMAAISIDRYYVICHCFHALMNVSPNRTLLIILLVWVYACIWSIPPFVGIGAYVEEGYGIGCTFDYVTRDLNTLIYIVIIYVGGFIFPVFTIAVCYTKIFRAVNKHKKEIGKYSKAKTTGERTSSANQKHNNNKKRNTKFSRLMAHYQLAKVGVIATVIFCLSWGPYATIALYSQFAINQPRIGPIAQIIPVVFAKMSSIWNPFVYAVSHKRFKKSLASTLRSVLRNTESRFTRSNTGSDHIPGDSSRTSRKGNRSSVSASSMDSDVLPQPPTKPIVDSDAHLQEPKKPPLSTRHSDPGINVESVTKCAVISNAMTGEKPLTPKSIELETISGRSNLVRNVFFRKTWHPHGINGRVIANDYV